MTEQRRLYVIWSLEHSAWWRDNWCGYTRELALAGVYDEDDSQKILDRANYPPGRFNECRIPIETVGRAYLYVDEPSDEQRASGDASRAMGRTLQRPEWSDAGYGSEK